MNQTVKKVRELFARSDERRDKNFTTPSNMVRHDNIVYGPEETWNLLDVYYKKGTTACQKTIVSIHGGGWVYGDKDHYQYYCMDLAERGFTVVNFSYRLAPESKYPAALEDINRVFSWVKEHAKDYYIDIEKICVVGDSAGAQLSSQYLTILTNPEYQKLFSFEVPEIKIRAVALNCGIYDAKEYCSRNQDELLKCYFGKNPETEESIDVMRYLDGNFPPAFIMTAHCDPMKPHAEPLHEKLQALGVECKLRIYGTPENKKVAHVFHCNIVLPEAIACNDDECEFFTQYCENDQYATVSSATE